MKRSHVVVLSIAAVAVIGAGVWLAFGKKSPPHHNSTPATSQPEGSQAAPTPGFNKQLHSLTDSDSPWVIANKSHPLPVGYAPRDLVTPNVLLRLAPSHEQMKVSNVMAPALEAMFAAAKRDGITLRLSSAYRSEALQSQFYNSYVARDGQEAADKYSARPGTSEHQTGLSADIIPANNKCHLEVCFADLPEGKWLAAHAYEHGFIIRYLNGKEASTGYQYEPWHIRYVGEELSHELQKTGLTMEEFFNF